MNKSRILYFDVLRLMSMMAIIIVHIAALDMSAMYGTSEWPHLVIFNSLFRWGLPVFVMISGAIFLDPQRDVTIGELYKKRIPRLLIAYLFWWIAYVPFRVLLKGQEFSMDNWLTPHVHLWFLPMMMGLYMVVPLLRPIVREKRSLQYFILLWFFLLTFAFVPVLAEPIGRLVIPLAIGNCGFFVLGYYLSHTSFTRRWRLALYLMGIVSAVVIYVGTLSSSYAAGKPDFFFNDGRGPFYVFLSAAIFLFVKNHCDAVKPWIERMIDFVRKDLYGIYLVHLIFAMLLARPAIRHFASPLVIVPSLAVAIFVCSLFVVKIIRKIPILKKVVE